MKEKILPSNRKDHILSEAFTLFREKGYESTSVADICEAAGVARGTLYYHYPSKEAIMDAIIEGQTQELIKEASIIAQRRNIPVLQRLVMAIQAMNHSSFDSEEMMDYLHAPENALMHRKVSLLTLETLPNVILPIIEHGIEEGLFTTDYPLEALRMIFAYSDVAFDQVQGEKGELLSFLYLIEKVLGAQPGTLKEVIFQTMGDAK